MKLTDDKRYMMLALSLGRRGHGNTAPNPSVGCVIVNQGRIVGRGWTQTTGRPHAETMALAQAGSAAQGADVYVTLEPCAHYGQTPPCAKGLIAARVKRIVVAVQDPEPRVNGAGLEMLRAAGITVETGLCADIAAMDLVGFMLMIKQKRPFVTLKLASSFDGRIATGSGESQWITGTQARHAVHAMRARHDAVMIGGGTARHDDPSLTVRDIGISYQPIRIVASRGLDIPLKGKLARTAAETPLVLCHGADADPALQGSWRNLGANLLQCNIIGTQLDPRDILHKLALQGITRVFCEGGGALAASMIQADLVDRLVGFTAGLTIGAEGLPNLGLLGLKKLTKAPRFNLQSVSSIGNDICHEWTREIPDF